MFAELQTGSKSKQIHQTPCTLCPTKIKLAGILYVPLRKWHVVQLPSYIRVILLSPYWRIHGISLSSTHFNQLHHTYINQRHQ
jgi:hypothetical protein